MKIWFFQCKNPDKEPEETLEEEEEEEEERITLLTALILLVGYAIFISCCFFEKGSQQDRILLFAKLCRCFPERVEKILLSDTKYFIPVSRFSYIWIVIIILMESREVYPHLFVCLAEVNLLVLGVFAIRQGYLDTRETAKDVEIV